jgi:UDP-N-acetylglucosamine 4,6-dehydratase
MITEDDARTVKELPDGFIIEPAFPFWTDQGYSHADARPVPENFYYASDSNPHWLTDEELRVFLRDLYPND